MKRFLILLLLFAALIVWTIPRPTHNDLVLQPAKQTVSSSAAVAVAKTSVPDRIGRYAVWSDGTRYFKRETPISFTNLQSDILGGDRKAASSGFV